MLDQLRWLALEVKYLDRAQSFYEAFLDLEVRAERERETALAVGDSDLILRAPGDVPRGGLHTHYALSIPHGEYDDWFERLDRRFDLVEETFGDATSLYFYDPDGNCVELGQSDVAGPGIDGVFEVVFEVEDLSTAQSFYEGLGFEVVDEGGERPRVRMTTGEFDIELWEPQLGLADARGGVHVDVGIDSPDVEATVDAVRPGAQAVTTVDDGYRFRDPDGHSLTILEE
jgi:catechol 2,3-dioxygenase-like lactoylglutathione lyase family enzyme